MSINKTPFGVQLEMPTETLLRIHAVFDSDQPCLEHQVAYSGSVPCTGALVCYLCGGRWDEDGKYLGRRAAA